LFRNREVVMTKIVERISDGLLAVFAPRIQASAICPPCRWIGQCGSCNGNRRYRIKECLYGPGCQAVNRTCSADPGCAP
jgi:hypothetical protein